TEQVKANRLPIVQYHGGYEYSNNPSGVTERRLKAAIDNGAAMAIAHHPHVTQGIELYKGKLIAYSMGNFIFDQYIPSTPYSFMLYVWMDGQKFHRAEIVPLYLKGYKPTPATGINRYTTMKRLTSLSSQRNTKISQSGGHGVISSKSILSQPQQVTVSFPQKAKTAPLYLLPWQKDLVKINPPKNVAYRLGTNLMNASDFESFSTFNSDERSWFFDRENTVLNSYGASGSRSLGVTIKKGKTSEIGLQAFRRKFKGDAPTTITAKFKTTQPAKVNFYWQGRRFKQKFFQARKESKKYLIGSVDLKPKTTWQKVELDFNSVRYNYPSNGFRAYRVMAEIELANGQTGKVDIDDFAVIEWQSAFSESETPIHINLESSQASFIGINKPTNQKVNLTLQ
ncbi:MAG: CapA family protein, partial [Kangiellaceae bacterium]